MIKKIAIILIIIAVFFFVGRLIQGEKNEADFPFENEIIENGGNKKGDPNGSDGNAGLNDKKEIKIFFQCLADKGIVIYGSRYCPACSEMIESFGGYDAVAPAYVECEENMDQCLKELKTGYVPEIQIKGEVYQGEKTLESLAKETGCEL